MEPEKYRADFPVSRSEIAGTHPAKENLPCSLKANTVGVDYDEVPPVPIPNTVVKLICADNTWRVTAWEDK